jgi:hypothetical protein
VRELLTGSFGAEIWSTVGASRSGVPVVPTSSTVFDRIPNEPGVPESTGVDRYVVNADSPTDVIIIKVDLGTLEVTVPRGTDRDWIRVARADDGLTIALGRLRRDGAASSARLAYGLPTPITDLHFDVTSNPLDPLADRLVRRRRWAESLIRSSRSRWLSRPLRSLRDARLARIVAMGLRDRSLVDESRRLARRAMYSMTLRGVVVLAALVAAFALTRDEESGPSTSVPVAPTSGPAVTSLPEATTSVPVVVERTSATYTYADGSSLDVRLDVEANGSATLVVTDTQRSVTDFGRAPGDSGEPIDEERYRRTCLELARLDVSDRDFMRKPSWYDVRVVATDSTGSDPVLVASQRAELRQMVLLVDPEACRAARADENGSFAVDVSIVLEDVVVPIDLSDPAIGRGSWRVIIDRVDASGAASSAQNDQAVIVKVP